MPSSAACVEYGDGYRVYRNGMIWKKWHTTTRSDGVVRRWKPKVVPTRIRNTSKGKGGGYVYCDLRIDGKRTTKLLHRVVAECFLPNPEGLSDVNHKDGNRSNNTVANLEWMSRSDNQKHAYSILKRKRKSKLTDYQMKVIQYLRNVKKLRLKEIADLYEVDFRTVSEIAKGKRFVLRGEDT